MRTFSLSILYSFLFFFFFFNDTATTEIYTLSLHDALPISLAQTPPEAARRPRARGRRRSANRCRGGDRDRKSTRLNSSHGYISYAVFCLKKKKKKTKNNTQDYMYAKIRTEVRK